MRLPNFTSTSLAFVLISVTAAVAAAAPSAKPITKPTSASVSSSSTPADQCRTCLAKELVKIPKCDNLSPNTPALPATERNPAKIQAYRAKYPDVVDCLCVAARRADDGPQDWISRCDKLCFADVAKNQRRILKNFDDQFSCSAPKTHPEPPKSKPQVDHESDEASAKKHTPPPSTSEVNHASTPPSPSPSPASVTNHNSDEESGTKSPETAKSPTTKSISAKKGLVPANSSGTHGPATNVSNDEEPKSVL
ncbi:hypothetical protein FBU30_002491 [Linnemannia zychae]|nr:hypothetical protein FBU30_002491 [Linnemannia zychae]